MLTACADRALSINKGASPRAHRQTPAQRERFISMSPRQGGAPAPTVRSRDELIAWIAAGSKPASAWRIGTEHEKFLFTTHTLRPGPYGGERGVRALMEGLIAHFGWEPILEEGNIIALKRPDGEKGGTVSLEPGGQF